MGDPDEVLRNSGSNRNRIDVRDENQNLEAVLAESRITLLEIQTLLVLKCRSFRIWHGV